MKITRLNLELLFKGSLTNTFIEMYTIRFIRKNSEREQWISNIYDAFCLNEGDSCMPQTIEDVLKIDPKLQLEKINELSWKSGTADDRVTTYLQFLDFLNKFSQELFERNEYKL